MLSPTLLKKKFKLKCNNQMEKKTKQKQSRNGSTDKLKMR